MQPVICSFFLCVVFISGYHTGLAYVSMGLMYCLYTRVLTSLDWPNVVLVSARMTLNRVFTLVFIFWVCELKVNFFVCHTECSGCVGVGYGCVIECNCRL